MFKRVFLFLAVNFLIIVSVSFILNFFNITPYLTKSGIDYGMLVAFCLVWGMTGSVVSLLISRWIAKRSYGVQLINPNTQVAWERFVLSKVYESARKSGIQVMPEVGVYTSPEINAFATGPTRNRALVALSSGTIENLNEDQVEGIIGHEVAHIANGDMVTMTLLQGLVNAFVLFLSRAVAHVIVTALKKDEDRGSHFVFYIVSFILEMILMVLGSIVVAYFSRQREFRADRDSTKLVGKEKMIAALEALKSNVGVDPGLAKNTGLKNLQISSESTWMNLFASHPPLSRRIKRLKEMR